MRITPATGTRFLLSFDHVLDAGTAPSRLKAKSIREQLVMQAMVQNSWPIAEMNRTAPPHLEVSAWEKITATAPPPLLTPSGLCTAKRNESSRIHPPMAE